jgi:hypothetical protein
MNALKRSMLCRHSLAFHSIADDLAKQQRVDKKILDNVIPDRVIGFFNAYREGRRVTRNLLRGIAQQFQNWVKNRSQKWGAPILEAPQGRRDDFVDPYFKHAKKDEVLVILKSQGTGPDHGCYRGKRSLASAVGSTLDRAI